MKNTVIKLGNRYVSVADNIYDTHYAQSHEAFGRGLTKAQATKLCNTLRRQSRYGQLVRGWPWRTEQSLLDRADALRTRVGISRTEALEMALTEWVERNNQTD